MKEELISDGDAEHDVAGAGKPPIILKIKKGHVAGTASKSGEDADIPIAKKQKEKETNKKNGKKGAKNRISEKDVLAKSIEIQGGDKHVDIKN